MKLAINGINLGAMMAAEEPPDTEARDIGEVGIALDGTSRVTRSARKFDVSFGSIPMPLATALAWRMLLSGEGEAWSFDGNLYGSKGSGPSINTNTSQSAGSAKYGGGKLQVGATTGVITYLSAATSMYGDSTRWTVMVWRFESGAWHHYAVRSDGAKWYDGARADGTSTTWLTVTSGNVSIANVTGSAVNYDDLVVLPFVVLDAWPPAIYAAAVAYGPPPYLLATGDLVDEAPSRLVYGVVESSSTVLAASGLLRTLDVALVAR